MTKKVTVKTETTVSAQSSAVVLDKSAEALIQEFNTAKAVIKEMTERKEAAEQALKELLAGAEIGLIDGVQRVKLSARTRSDIDRDDLKEVYPEAYELCLKHKTYYVLTAVS